VTLSAFFPQAGRPFLIGYLDQTEGRLKAINKKELNVLLGNRGVCLIKNFKEKAFIKIIIGPENMKPGALTFWIGMKNQPGKSIFHRQRFTDFII